ncbi:hypothetical protein K474DRAFT_641868 [Panus rudis PR-1116 ss-1]|nr:hypothetical protein K474DRAFT_641868 [Panus rudis PR-1116 ss-1]
MTSSHKFTPFIPKELLRKLESDPVVASVPSIFRDKQLHEWRLKCLKCPDYVDIPFVVQLSDSNVHNGKPVGFSADDRCTILHQAAIVGDILLAHESIRMGCELDAKDREGMTPLYMACKALHGISGSSFANLSARMDISRSIPDMKERLARVIALLVEQRANLQVELNRNTPLTFLIKIGRWSLVDLCLQHGATIPGSLLPLTLSPASHARLQQAIDLHTPTSPSSIPPQPCPCWSGKLLRDCHMRAQPYPSEFLCLCASGKTYGRCCGKKGNPDQEKWTEEGRYIYRSTRYKMPVYDVPPELAALIPEQRSVPLPDMSQDFIDILLAFSLNVMIAGGMDCAWVYAYKKSRKMPFPIANQFSKFSTKSTMDTWNSLIDEYIASGQDSRSSLKIELANKVGPNLGPLYKRCEADGCSKQEGVDDITMRRCSNCQLIYYCSPICQRKDWARHKAVCEAKGHREQELPPQTFFHKFWADLVRSFPK